MILWERWGKQERNERGVSKDRRRSLTQRRRRADPPVHIEGDYPDLREAVCLTVCLIACA